MFKRGLALATSLAGLALTAGAGPASAAASGTVSAPGQGVLFSDCRNVAVPYSFSLPAGADYFSVDVETISPDGTHGPSGSASSFSDNASGGAHSGSAQLQFCGYEMPGTYTVAATGEYSDYEGDVQDAPISFNTVSFTMRLPQTKTALKAKPVRGGERLTVQVQDERPAGFFGTEYADFTVQVFSRGKWRSIVKDSTDSHGRYVVTEEKPRGRTKVRAITKDSDRYTGSTSPTLTLR